MRFLLLALLSLASFGTAHAEDTLKPLHWQSQGIFGSYDKAALQRGLLVYQTACAGCHSMNLLHYRDLEALGLTPEQVAAFASNVKLDDGSAATLDDVLKDPHINPAAFGGAVPPDLSTIINARPKGIFYVDGILTGYTPAPAGVTLIPGHYYNTGYPGNQIAMPPPLRDHEVTYADGTNATTAQEAQDVTAYLAWSADPNLNARHEIGVRAIMFLVFLTIIAIATKRKIWRESI